VKAGARSSAILCFVVVAIFGYAALRLRGAIGEPDPRTVGPSLHVGYYWRVATAIWWGTLAAVGGWRFPEAGAWAARALPVVVGAATIAAFVVP
jgi:hypothetical protein